MKHAFGWGQRKESEMNKYNIWYVRGRPSWKCVYEVFVSRSGKKALTEKMTFE